MSIAYKAMLFAREAHKNQKRKYTGNAYTDHLGEVADIVASVPRTEEMIAIAWLHDCIEDQGVEIATLVSEFGVQGYRERLTYDFLHAKGTRCS